jgi:lysophospholipase L1-like esterase
MIGLTRPTAWDAQSSMSYRHLVALGSSFAAGPGIEPIADRGAMRSARNYPHVLAEHFGAQLTDLTVSGATIATILSKTQRSLRAARFAPQLDGVPDDADLATVTIGGNDLKYMAGLIGTSAVGQLRRLPVVGGPASSVLAHVTLPQPKTADYECVAEGIATITQQLRSRAPRVRVVLVDYFTVFGPDARPSADVPLRRSEIEQFRSIGESLARAYAVAAERTGADLVKVSELSAAHGLGSSEPWLVWFRHSSSAAPYHPNAAGMQAVADAIAAHLDN